MLWALQKTPTFIAFMEKALKRQVIVNERNDMTRWSPEFFRLLYAIAKNCLPNWEDHSFHWFIHHGNIWSHKWTPLIISSFTAQLVRASHQHREVTGSIPEIFRLLHVIAKIVFVTARIIASVEVIVKLNCCCCSGTVWLILVPFLYAGSCGLNFVREHCIPWDLYPRSMCRFYSSAKEFVLADRKRLYSTSGCVQFVWERK